MSPQLGLLIAIFITVAVVLYHVNRTGRQAGRRRGPWLPEPGAILVKNREATIRTIDDETILALPHQKEGLALNPMAARCWELIDGQRDLARIAATVSREFPIDEETAVEDVRSLAALLRREYLALPEGDWRFVHMHFDMLFAGASDRGIKEIRRANGMIVHLAEEVADGDGLPNTRHLRAERWSWLGAGFQRYRARASMDRHNLREATLHEALHAFEAGWCQCQAGNLDEAERSFLKACRLAPRWAHPHYQLGYLHLLGGRFLRAVEDFHRAERMDPGGFMVREYLNMASKMAEGRICFEAFRLFEEASTAASEEPERALSLCRRALSLSPDLPPARLIMARIHARRRHFERALHALRETIDTDPDSSTLCHALCDRGAIFMEHGMIDQAVREFEKVIELDGSPAATRRAMARLTSCTIVH